MWWWLKRRLAEWKINRDADVKMEARVIRLEHQMRELKRSIPADDAETTRFERRTTRA